MNTDDAPAVAPDTTPDAPPVDAADLLATAAPIDGAVKLHVSFDAEHGLIRLDFSGPTRGVSMDPEAVRALAKALREYANEADQSRGGRSIIPNNLDRGRGKGRRRW